MRKKELVLVAELFCATAFGLHASAQSINNISFNHAEPSECDDVIVTVNGQLNSIDAYVSQSSFTRNGSDIVINLNVEQPANGNPGLAIFTENVNLGGIPAEDYNIEVRLVTSGNTLASDAAHLTVLKALSAGQSSSAAICDVESYFNLVSLLGPMHATGGTWFDMDQTGAISTSGVLNANGLNGTYHFTYYYPGEGNCPSSEATITINVSRSPEAGNDAAVEVCSGINHIDLSQEIGPHDSGIWMDVEQTGALSDNGLLNISRLTPGQYRFEYSVYGTGFCPTAKSAVDVNVDVCSGIGIGKEPSLSIYPNPSAGKLQVNLGLDWEKYNEVVIYNPAGAVVSRFSLDNFPVNTALSIDVSGFRKGIYIVMINGEDSTISRKLVIQ